MTDSSAAKSAVERLLEVGVYAPLGYLLTRTKTRPELIAAGRKQIAFTRSLGRAALQGMSRSRGGPSTPAPVRPAPATDAIEATDVSEVTEVTEVSVVSEVAVSAAIDGYDAMTAKEIIALAGSASADQLNWIGEYEAGHKQRVTVLRSVAKNQAVANKLSDA